MQPIRPAKFAWTKLCSNCILASPKYTSVPRRDFSRPIAVWMVINILPDTSDKHLSGWHGGPVNRQSIGRRGQWSLLRSPMLLGINPPTHEVFVLLIGIRTVVVVITIAIMTNLYAGSRLSRKLPPFEKASNQVSDLKGNPCAEVVRPELHRLLTIGIFLSRL